MSDRIGFVTARALAAALHGARPDTAELAWMPLGLVHA
jgi:hypothetical protein